jgi:hypothetical protein
VGSVLHMSCDQTTVWSQYILCAAGEKAVWLLIRRNRLSSASLTSKAPISDAEAKRHKRLPSGCNEEATARSTGEPWRDGHPALTALAPTPFSLKGAAVPCPSSWYSLQPSCSATFHGTRHALRLARPKRYPKMIGNDNWRKFRRVMTTTNAFADTARNDGDVIPRTGGIQGRYQGPHRDPDDMPPSQAPGPSYAPVPHCPQHQHTGMPTQNHYQGQPSQPYTPQHQSGPFGLPQRMYTSPAAATGFAQQLNLVPTFDPLNRNQALSAPPRPFDTTGGASYDTPQRTSPPASGGSPQDPNSFSSDPRYASRGIQPAANQGYYDQGSYPPQSYQEPQHQAQYGQPPRSWNQNAGPSTYQSNTTGTCTQCSSFLAQ